MASLAAHYLKRVSVMMWSNCLHAVQQLQYYISAPERKRIYFRRITMAFTKTRLILSLTSCASCLQWWHSSIYAYVICVMDLEIAHCTVCFMKNVVSTKGFPLSVLFSGILCMNLLLWRCYGERVCVLTHEEVSCVKGSVKYYYQIWKCLYSVTVYPSPFSVKHSISSVGP